MAVEEMAPAILGRVKGRSKASLMPAKIAVRNFYDKITLHLGLNK
jgi:hypothetical protein